VVGKLNIDSEVNHYPHKKYDMKGREAMHLV
jgi:hypothetical protein